MFNIIAAVECHFLKEKKNNKCTVEHCSRRIQLEVSHREKNTIVSNYTLKSNTVNRLRHGM